MSCSLSLFIILSVFFKLHSILFIKLLLLFYTVNPYLDLLIFAIFLFTIPSVIPSKVSFEKQPCELLEGGPVLPFYFCLLLFCLICNESSMRYICGRQSLDDLCLLVFTHLCNLLSLNMDCT